jgi:hypothetical protein
MCRVRANTGRGPLLFALRATHAAPYTQTWTQRLFSSGGFEFEGDVSPQGFDITRIISYRNSCIPVIRGRFEPSGTGKNCDRHEDACPRLRVPGWGLNDSVHSAFRTCWKRSGVAGDRHRCICRALLRLHSLLARICRRSQYGSWSTGPGLANALKPILTVPNSAMPPSPFKKSAPKKDPIKK